MKNIFKYLILFFLILIMIGCANQNTTANQEKIIVHQDGPAILFIGGKEYVFVRDIENGEYTIDEMVGKVKTKVPINITPNSDYDSNSLEAGTEIHSVKEDKNVFLAKITENKFHLYEFR